MRNLTKTQTMLNFSNKSKSAISDKQSQLLNGVFGFAVKAVKTCESGSFVVLGANLRTGSSFFQPPALPSAIAAKRAVKRKMSCVYGYVATLRMHASYLAS